MAGGEVITLQQKWAMMTKIFRHEYIWWRNGDETTFVTWSTKIKKRKRKKNRWRKTLSPNLLKLEKKKNIWWRNNSSLKIRFSDEKLMPPIIFYWWRKNFVTYHFLLVTKKFHYLSIFYWWQKIFVTRTFGDRA